MVWKLIMHFFVYTPNMYVHGCWRLRERHISTRFFSLSKTRPCQSYILYISKLIVLYLAKYLESEAKKICVKKAHNVLSLLMYRICMCFGCWRPPEIHLSNHLFFLFSITYPSLSSLQQTIRFYTLTWDFKSSKHQTCGITPQRCASENHSDFANILGLRKYKILAYFTFSNSILKWTYFT